jgi:hypothetical protein
MKSMDDDFDGAYVALCRLEREAGARESRE